MGTVYVDNIKHQSAQGSGTITLGASGETINIPSGVTMTNSGTATGFGGITEADQWRLTTDFTGTAFLTSNLERPDTYGLSYMGTGMSQSSGVFTFPSTGYWYVIFNTAFKNPSTSIRVFWNEIHTTTDNSTYNLAARGFSNSYDFSSEHHTSVEAKIIFDVTNTTTHKVKFGVGTDAEHIVTDGDTNQNYTYMTFIKLGDT